MVFESMLYASHWATELGAEDTMTNEMRINPSRAHSPADGSFTHNYT